MLCLLNQVLQTSGDFLLFLAILNSLLVFARLLEGKSKLYGTVCLLLFCLINMVMFGRSLKRP